jgi:hypothetical protein
MFKKAVLFLAIVFLASINIHAQDYTDVEIFDITQGKVVKVVKSNSAIQKEVISYVKNINGIYTKFNPIPENGHAVRVPLNPSLKVKNKWTDTLVHEVIIVFPKGQNSSTFLMFFEDDNKLMCFNFEGDTRKLWELLDYKINQ